MESSQAHMQGIVSSASAAASAAATLVLSAQGLPIANLVAARPIASCQLPRLRAARVRPPARHSMSLALAGSITGTRLESGGSPSRAQVSGLSGASTRLNTQSLTHASPSLSAAMEMADDGGGDSVPIAPDEHDGKVRHSADWLPRHHHHLAHTHTSHQPASPTHMHSARACVRR